MAADKYLQALQHLLPSGYAWPRDEQSVLMRFLSGTAATLNDVEALIEVVARAWRPQTTNTRLEEWEEAAGLPDGCFGADQAVVARRGRLLSRLRGASGHYADSSPASPSAIEAICTNLGYPAVARYNTPLRCGRDRVGGRLGQLDGKLHLLLSASSAPFRVGANRVGSRLAERPAGAIQLACYLEKYLPARFELVISFT